MRHRRIGSRKWPWMVGLSAICIAVSGIWWMPSQSPTPGPTGAVLQLPSVDPLPPYKPAPTKEVTPSKPAATPTPSTKPTASTAPTGKPQPTTSATPSTKAPSSRTPSTSSPKPSPKPSASSTPSSVPAISRTEEARLHINEHRSNLVGAPPLARYPGMDAAAQAWAEEMAKSGTLKHSQVRPYRAEVIASGADTASEAVQLWLNSPPHKETILNPAYTMTGIGYADGYWCMLFN